MGNKNSGIYLLEIILNNEKKIKIGALGEYNFSTGYYYYIGSAQKNLQSRINRHLKDNKKLHWHIDYLLNYAQIINHYTILADKNYECKLFQYLNKKEIFQVPVKGLGASDCNCRSHLLYTEEKQNIKIAIEKFKQRNTII